MSLKQFELENCRICGFHYYDFFPWGDDGKTPTYDLCLCCGAEFGFDDETQNSIKKYRTQWIKSGKTFVYQESCPIMWNPDEQLKLIPEQFR